MRLHQTPPSDLDRAKTIKTLLAPLGLIVYGSAMPFWLLNYYVIPYQVGTGEILPDGSVNWTTGEALITLAVFVLHVPLALMAMKVIWDRYNPQTKRNQKILHRARLKAKMLSE
jgi:sodium/pantothenate symporter